MNAEITKDAVEANEIPAYLKRDQKPVVNKSGEKETFVQTEAEVGGKPVH